MSDLSLPSESLEATVDRISVADLPLRYGIKQPTVYERFKAVGVKPRRSGRHSFLNAEQLRLMDNLHAHLKRGEGIKDFVQSRQNSLQQNSSGSVQSPQPILQQSSTRPLAEDSGFASPGWFEFGIDALKKAFPSFWAAGEFVLAPLSSNQQITNAKLDVLIEQGERAERRAVVREETELVLLRYEKLQKSIQVLEDVVAGRVMLSTSQVADLLGLSSATVGAKQSFDRMGFHFAKAGRSGRETAWEVSKVVAATSQPAQTENSSVQPN